jgi:mRNA-degrading endonuclease RelE of RelBE toxin-antitoxin system
MPWELAISRRAARDLDDLPRSEREAIEAAISRLSADLSAAAIRKLRGRTGEWRLRVGRWRVFLELDNRAGRITVTRVRPRSRAYRD